ncbi:MAG: hypothetical protein M2R45_05355 [Verrucomicrobia subdivision 3 bacterium]|nr:hypothetical protein [Limisphaerales bacterium]MCS1417783.1 hypothetical protein [Limisphaerales bacterium]
MDSPGGPTSAQGIYEAKIKAVLHELHEEYLAPHDHPWIIGFSGGKDSTLLLHLVIECMQRIAPDERTRRVYIVCNNTLVESPVYQSFVDSVLDKLEESLGGLNVPVKVVRTNPLIKDSFWVNLIGKGYSAPTRNFRWCTDRLKIRPTSRFIRELVTDQGEAILLLGKRSAESSARAGSVKRHQASDGGRLSPDTRHKGVQVFSPIKELTTEDVWVKLIESRPPWGGSYRELLKLYRESNTSCPFVMSPDDAPSCGSSSARFGCWTCTVVKKDKSLDAMIDNGHEHLEPLSKFRNRLRTVSDTPEYRSKIRRNGQPGLGPLTMKARRMLLDELLDLQTETKMPLISHHEEMLIREQWEKDQTTEIMREFNLA